MDKVVFYPEMPLLRTSELLLRMAHDRDADTISFGDIVAVLGERAFGPALLIFALPIAIPSVPGTSLLLGLPLMLITLQMLVGRETLWLPPFLARKSIPHVLFQKIAVKAAAFMRPVEYLLKPRCHFIMTSVWKKLIETLMFTLAFIIFLPIPGFNMIPATVLAIIAIGFVERDGLVVLIGALAAMIVVGVLWTSLGLLVSSFKTLWAWLVVPLGWDH